MWIQIISASSWLFLVFPILIAALVLLCLDEESGFGAALVIAAGVVATTMFTDLNLFHWMRDHLNQIAIAIPFYVLVGGVWGIIKWYFFCLNAADAYALKREQIQAEYKKSLTNNIGRTFAEYVSYHYEYPPRPARNKNKIVLWMIYWPFSAVWTIINDPVRRIFNWLYARLVGFYSRIAQRVFSRFAEFNEQKG